MKSRQVQKNNTGFQHYFCLSSSSCFSSHLIHLCISLSVLLYLPRSLVSSSVRFIQLLPKSHKVPEHPIVSLSLHNFHLFHHSMHYLLRLHAALNVPSPPFFLLPVFHTLCPSPRSVSRSLALVCWYNPMADCQRGRAVQTPGGWRSWQPLHADTHPE